jgi:hypothetical protein
MLLKLILTILPFSILKWLLRRKILLRKWLRRPLLQVATRHAYRKFEKQYPTWAASLFDEYFLQGSAAPLLDRYAQPFNPPTPKELALAWFDQLGPLAPKSFRRRLNEVSWVAADFLWILEAELRQYELR